MDYLKYICAFLVLIVHIPPFGNNNAYSIPNFILQNIVARIAVPMYFGLSGFLYFRKENDNSNIDVNRTIRYLKKLLRMYLAWSVIYFPINLINIFHNQDGILHGFAIYLRNFFFVGSYTHLWYLNALIVSLASILLMKKMGIKRRYILLIAFLLYCCGLLGQSWFGVGTHLKNVPYLGKLLIYYRKIFVTTRNGIFEGLIFVSLGMLFAQVGMNMNRKKIAWGLVGSLALLFCEAIFVNVTDIARYYDMYFMLIPVVFFLMNLTLSIKIRDFKYRHYFRALWTLVFFIHMAIKWMIVEMNIEVITETSLLFIITIVLSVLLAAIIIELSKRIPVLKILYS